MNTARVLATAVWSVSLVSACVVGGLLDPPTATVTVAVALVATISGDVTTAHS